VLLLTVGAKSYMSQDLILRLQTCSRHRIIEFYRIIDEFSGHACFYWLISLYRIMLH